MHAKLYILLYIKLEVDACLQSDSTEAAHQLPAGRRRARGAGVLLSWTNSVDVNLLACLPVSLSYQGSVGPVGCRGDPGFEGAMVSWPGTLLQMLMVTVVGRF